MERHDTGAAGYWLHLAAELLRRGWAVTGLDARSPPATRWRREPGGADRRSPLPVVAGDVNGRGPAMVCEASGRVHWRVCGRAEVVGRRFGDYLACNVLGTQRLLEALRRRRRARVGFCLVVQRLRPGYWEALEEADLPLPLRRTGCRSWRPSGLCLAYASQRGLGHQRGRAAVLHRCTAPGSARTWRSAGPCGPRWQAGRVAVRDGAQRRDFTYVSDAVAATIAAATARPGRGRQRRAGRSVPAVGGPQG